jgi:hypothetical protein
MRLKPAGLIAAAAAGLKAWAKIKVVEPPTKDTTELFDGAA